MPLADLPPPAHLVSPPLQVQVSTIDLALTSEKVPVAPGMKMGMVGLHALRPVTPNLRIGPSVFGATTGDRGGFFGWGISAAYRWRLDAWSADAGLFVGGGGGSPGWVGGGLMLRPSLLVSRAVGPLRLGLGVSQVNFPSGTVRATVPFASLAWTGAALFGPAGGGPGLATQGWHDRAWPTETGATLGQYTLHKRSARRDGAGNSPPLQVGGLVFRRDLPGDVPGYSAGVRPYWLLSTAGAITAEYAGYAEFLGGLGLRYALPFYPPLALRVEAAVGSGGAGTALDTAGGLLGKAGVGLSWQFGRQWSLTALAGLTESRGRFSAQETRLELAWRGWDVVPGDARAPDAPSAALHWKPWTGSAGWAQYTQIRRADGSEPGLGVVTLKLEREIGPHWRLVGQAGIASNGRAGGYATGQLGLGWLGPALFDQRWRFGAEATLGAAGGGAVDVGGGLIAQVQGVARYAVTPGWALQVDGGWLRSRHGAMSSPFVGLSSVVSFSRLQAP